MSESRRIRNLLWDWNGTLLDDVEHCLAVVNSMLSDEGKPAVDLVAYREAFDFPVIKYYAKVGLPTEPEDFARLSRQFVATFNGGIRRCCPHVGATRLVRHWHATGRTQAVLSATRQDHLEALVALFGLSDYFSMLAGIGDIYASGKLERGREVLTQLGWDPAETLLIGDTQHDHEVAEALGLPCLLVAEGHQSEARLRATGAFVVPTLSPEVLDATPFRKLFD